MQIAKKYVKFPQRENRTRFIADHFHAYLQDTVLDVGCYEAPLRSLLPDTDYTGIDIAGKPDIKLNLEQCDRLPFDDGHFDTVMCIEVLEHLNNLHSMFSELLRVSKQHAIISLPNCWRDARVPVERGRGEIAHYGLPIDPPLDRHKWYFSYTEARDFLLEQARRHNCDVVEVLATEKPKPAPIRWLRKLRHPGDKYENRYTQTVWVVLKKRV